MSTSLKRRLRSTADRAARLCGILASRERDTARGLTVLTYHRVLPEERCAGYPFPSLVMPLGAFREQVRWLAAHGEILPLARALERCAHEPRERPLFALTFDDGYRDANVAAEVLEEVGARGTFFVTTGFVGGDGLLWFDEAALLFAEVEERARREIVGALRGARRDHALPAPGSDAATWAASLKSCRPAERRAILSALAHEAGGAPTADGYGALSIAQVVDLARRGHEIGSHTVTHPILPDLDDASLRSEVERARTTLSTWLGGAVPGFCYPNGDHDERVVAAVARAGHTYACTTRDGIHSLGDDPFRIRRVDVVAERVTNAERRFDPTAFRRELCGLYRRRRA